MERDTSEVAEDVLPTVHHRDSNDIDVDIRHRWLGDFPTGDAQNQNLVAALLTRTSKKFFNRPSDSRRELWNILIETESP